MLALLLGYLLSPIDLIPDFVPVLGYADDAIIATIAIRSAVRHAGADRLARHWPGTPEKASQCSPDSPASPKSGVAEHPEAALSHRTGCRGPNMIATFRVAVGHRRQVW